jgi:hypothetical protein
MQAISRFLFCAFSSREPVSTSLENALMSKREACHRSEGRRYRMGHGEFNADRRSRFGGRQLKWPYINPASLSPITQVAPQIMVVTTRTGMNVAKVRACDRNPTSAEEQAILFQRKQNGPANTANASPEYPLSAINFTAGPLAMLVKRGSTLQAPHDVQLIGANEIPRRFSSSRNCFS